MELKLLTYISLFISLSLNAQNMVIDCVYTLETEQFKSVSESRLILILKSFL